MSEQLSRLVQSGDPLISIESINEDRARRAVVKAAGILSRPIREWSMTTGLRKFDGGRIGPTLVTSGKASDALSHIREKGDPRSIYLFRDLGPHCKDALVHRMLRDLAESFSESKSTIILLDAFPLPEEIRRLTVRFEIGWPGAEELAEIVKRTYQRLRKDSLEKITHSLSNRDMEQLVQTLRGLTEAQAERVISAAVIDDSSLNATDLPRIIESKRTQLGSQGCLESIAADSTADQIGGLENLKSWLKQRRGGFTEEAIKFGLEPPRGLLMLGVPGCGKSLCAKVVAADWGMPLLRLDPGVLYQKFVGETESQLRQALAQAEAMAPCVLWVDEIEKAFASASASSADGGLSKRMFGTLLSWMQDHRHPIFIIATANDISALPPELMRKGRFDEIFFVDLPGPQVRAEILGIHLTRRRRDPQQFNLERLAQAADGFSGSELEQVVISAMFTAFSHRSDLSDEHMLQAISTTRPLSTLNAERIADLRDWAVDRCVTADRPH